MRKFSSLVAFLAVFCGVALLSAYTEYAKPYPKATVYAKHDSISWSAPYTVPAQAFESVSYCIQTGGSGQTVAGDTIIVVFVLPAGDSLVIKHGIGAVANSFCHTLPIQCTKYRVQVKETGSSTATSVQVFGWNKK
jgi:hypothetical protein